MHLGGPFAVLCGTSCYGNSPLPTDGDPTVLKGDLKMPQGTVKWFDNAKGYGFVTPENGGKDLFVHHTAIEGSGYKSLEEGQRVSFEVTQGPKGDQATKVTKL